MIYATMVLRWTQTRNVADTQQNYTATMALRQSALYCYYFCVHNVGALQCLSLTPPD